MLFFSVCMRQTAVACDQSYPCESLSSAKRILWEESCLTTSRRMDGRMDDGEMNPETSSSDESDICSHGRYKNA